EELDGEHLELLAAQLAVGELEPERVTAEGPAALDARDQISDEVLGGQNLAHCSSCLSPASGDQSDQGSLSQGRSSGVIPRPAGVTPRPTATNWRCAYISRAMPWPSSSMNARLRFWVNSMRV